MKTTSTQAKRLALAFAVSSLSVASVQAQDTSKGKVYELEEVLVTARKKEERLIDVPIAITAIDAKLLESTGAKGLEDIARLTPGFAFESTGGLLSQPSIRGVVQGRITNPVQNIATYFNGVYLQRSYQIDVDLLDIERVEIAKGPQSALFGRNAFGGAISYVTKTPDLEDVRASAEIGIGSDELETLRGSISIPLGGKAAISLSATTSEFDGTWENENVAGNALDNSTGALRTNGNLGGHDKSGYLVQFYTEPTDNFSAKAFYSQREEEQESLVNYGLSSIGAIRAGANSNCGTFDPTSFSFLRNPTANFGFFCGELPVAPVILPGEPRPEGILIDRRAYSLDAEAKIAGLNLSFDVSDAINISYDYGYTNAEADNLGMLSGDPVNGTFAGQVLFDSRGNGEIETDSHDIRFNFENDGIRALAGVFISTTDDYSYGASLVAPPNSQTPFNNDFFGFAPPASFTGSVVAPGYAATQRDEDILGLYGLVSFDITDELNVTVEGRQNREEITEQAVGFFQPLDPAAQQFKAEFSYFTPRISASYKLNEGTNIYASGAKGVKSGGFNPLAILPEDQVYDPEENITYELGIKGNAMDGQLNYEAAVYMTEWTDLQGSRGQDNAVQGTPLILDNFSSADILGFEFSALYRLTDAITANAGFSLADAEYASDATDSRIPRALCSDPASPTCPTDGSVGGNQMQRTPKYQSNLGLAYDDTIAEFAGSDLNFYARVDYSFQSKQYVDPGNTAFVPARRLFDASFGVYNDNWNLRFWGKNITDERYVTTAFATIGAFTAAGGTYTPLLGEQRTLGATLSYTY